MMKTEGNRPDGRSRRRTRGRRRIDGGESPQPFESVERDFDEAPLDDLLRQAGRGAIDVADL